MFNVRIWLNFYWCCCLKRLNHHEINKTWGYNVIYSQFHGVFMYFPYPQRGGHSKWLVNDYRNHSTRTFGGDSGNAEACPWPCGTFWTLVRVKLRIIIWFFGFWSHIVLLFGCMMGFRSDCMSLTISQHLLFQRSTYWYKGRWVCKD